MGMAYKTGREKGGDLLGTSEGSVGSYMTKEKKGKTGRKKKKEERDWAFGGGT